MLSGLNLVDAAQYIVLAFGVLLLVKLFVLGLHRSYPVFCFFLAADLLGSTFWFVNQLGFHADYRLIWLVDRVVVWVLMVWTVVVLLNAVLGNYPGILRLSRTVLRVTMVSVAAVSILSAIPEYAQATPLPGDGWIFRSVMAGLVIERVVTSVSLGCLLTVLAFLVWFPVEVPRNLAAFCVGFVVYFLVSTTVLLANNYQSASLIGFVNITANAVEAACLAYWFLFLSKSGEFTRSKLSIRWHGAENDRLMAQLETLNRSLVRSSRR